MLGPLGVVIEKPPGRFEVHENGSTFADNACLKAAKLCALLKQPTVADDSGLEVDALYGAPGVYSARYAGVLTGGDKQDMANKQKLLQVMRATPLKKRGARMVCAIAYCALQTSTPQVFVADIIGHIALEPKGKAGFGYDAVFVPTGYNQTLDELTDEQKHAISHRGQALRQLADYLKGLQLL